MDAITAKQFLISKVIEHAELEQVSISEVERKMLHFTEVHSSLPDIHEVNAQFEQNYDSDQYEAKVATLLKKARNRDREQSPEGDQKWEDALNAPERPRSLYSGDDRTGVRARFGLPKQPLAGLSYLRRPRRWRRSNTSSFCALFQPALIDP